MSKAGEWKARLEARPVCATAGYEVTAKVLESGSCQITTVDGNAIIVPGAHVLWLAKWIIETWGEA